MATKLWTKNDCVHAAGRDFCHIFQEEMRSLYSLALILTNDRSAAEKCFVASLEDCLNAHSIFKEWALSWSKRAVIKNAIRVILPRPEKDGEASLAPVRMKSKSMLGDALLGLQHFQRFVTVMSVLESYSDKECALLLNCCTQDVVTARSQALRQLAQSAGPRLTAAVFRHDFELATALTPASHAEAANFVPTVS